jgi:Tfp pilus assembly protein PilE
VALTLHKKSFTLLEIVVVLILISLVIVIAYPKKQIDNLHLASQKLLIYLNYTRMIALMDNKFTYNDTQWEKKLWTLKFQRCSKAEDGLYFVVYSDESGGTAHFKKSETMKDPLNNKQLYMQSDCIAKDDESKNVLLTKNYGVSSVELSCNTTTTIGQISFGYDGNIYSSLGQNIQKVTQPCIITIKDDEMNRNQIQIEPFTGFIHKL